MYYLMYQGRKNKRLQVRLDRERCTDCEQCLQVCRQEVFALENSTVVVVDESSCNECNKCVETCVYDAVEIAWQEEDNNEEEGMT